MERSAKKEEEVNGENRRDLRLLRGWLHCMPYWDAIRTEKQFGRADADPVERTVEKSLLLQEEIERAQRTVRERIGTGSEASPWFREEREEITSENARLWRAVGHLAEVLERLSERLETLERRRLRARGNRPLAG
ncbi:hypothetical protein [Verrucomicrobium sp. 3C]|uniref:hypothetical protein n=1 Tax=Verrucomicrobium sp. 3C TaxID=1134055 RepID=UPI0003A2F479|nr:hypothetical protein [Verrucomicrobium sp. 3C]